MSKKEKLFQRVKNSAKNVRFQDFCTLLEYFGFVLIRIRGSHHLYQHSTVEEVMNIQSQENNMAKSYQVQQFLRLVETYQLRLTDEEEE